MKELRALVESYAGAADARDGAAFAADGETVLTITYEDRFGRDSGGAWRFAWRDVRVTRREEVPA